MKKLLCLFLAAVIVLSAGSCAASGANTGNINPGVMPDSTVPVGNAGFTVQAPDNGVIEQVKAFDGQLWISVYVPTGDTPAGYPTAYAPAIYKVDMATGALEQVCARSKGSIANFAPTPDGTVWVATGDPYEPETLFHISADNTVLASESVSDLTGADGFTYFSMAAAGEDGLAVSWGRRSGSAATLLDGDGYVGWMIETAGGFFWSLNTLDDGSVLGVFWNGDDNGEPTGMTLNQLDFAGRVMDVLPLEDDGGLDMDYENGILCGDSETIWLQSASGAVYAYGRATGQATEQFHWLDTGVNERYLAATFLREGKLWVAVRDEEDPDALHVFPLPMEDDRQVLTLGAFYISDDALMTQAVKNFNATNPDYRIHVIDYGNIQDDPMARFNADVEAGNMPDILSLYEFPYDSLRLRGLLTDLTDFVEADPDIRRGDYLSWAWQAGTASDGGLYALVNQFVFGTTWCAENDLTMEEFTLDKYMELAAAGELLVYMNDSGPEYRAWAAEGLIQCNLDMFMDMGTGTCAFDRQEFYDILETVGIMTIATGSQYGMTRLEGWQLDGFREMRLRVESGTPVAIGFPTPEGGVFGFGPRSELAISSQTEYPDACWQFVRTLLSDDIQNLAYGRFPVKKTALDVYAAKEMELGWYNSAPTEEDVAAVKEMFEKDMYVNRIFNSLTDGVFDIIHPILIDYYCGEFNAQTAAARINDQVSAYLTSQR